MSLFQCENCGCVENTALSCQGFKNVPNWFDWTGIEDRRGKKICSACGPSTFDDGRPTEFGVWHGEFERTFLPKGMFVTGRNGGLEHIETGDSDFEKYSSPEEFKEDE